MNKIEKKVQQQQKKRILKFKMNLLIKQNRP